VSLRTLSPSSHWSGTTRIHSTTAARLITSPPIFIATGFLFGGSGKTKR
jgi:hypothetical protein